VAIEGIGRIPAQLPDVRPTGPATGPGAPSFADALGQALNQVEAAQQESDTQAATAAGGGGNLHEVALAMEKADISLRVAAKVRNKLIEAYQEVMRMPV
jgi:flagellar hook-basal body complex protein FliE